MQQTPYSTLPSTADIAVRCLLGLALLAASAIAAAGPRSVSVVYNVYTRGVQLGQITESFEGGGNTYKLTSDTVPQGIFALAQKQFVRLTSQGEIGRQGLKPLRFEGRRGQDQTPQVTAEFDWTGSRLLMRNDGHEQTVTLPVGAQDRLSAMYQFMFAHPVPGKTYEVQMTNGRKFDVYRYTVTPNVEIDTPIGRISTVHLVKQQEANDTGNEIWLAPQYQYFPVRMVIVERDGSRYEQIVTRLDVRE